MNYGLEWDDPVNKLNMMLHAARRYFHDDNDLPNLEALKNIYQVVAQQLLNSRQRYIKKHHNQQPSVPQLQAGDLILIKNPTAKSFEPKYKGNYRVVKIHGNNMEIRDFRGNISMVYVTDVKRTTLMEQVADDYEQLGKQGRFSKKCIPIGYITDLDWTIHEDLDQPIRPVKQEEDPTETTMTPAAPPEVEGPPSSHLRSKTKQQTTSIQQGQLECNPPTVDPLECNPAQAEINDVQIAPEVYSLMQWTHTLLWAKRVSKHKDPIAARCTLMVAIVYVTDVKRTTLMEQVADDYEQLGKQGRFSKKCIPIGYITDLDWTTIHEDLDQPIRPVKQEEDPTETTTTLAAPPEVEGPPSSHLRSKTKQQTTSIQQGQLECNPPTVDPLECNPAQAEVNEVQIAPEVYSLMQWTHTLLWAKRVSNHKNPIAARCTLMVAMAVYNLKCNQTKVKSVQ